LIRKGEVVEADIDTLKVEQVGVNAFVLAIAKNSALFYALFCIILGAFSGWLANVVRLRP
jgi:cell division protein FtsX